MRACLAFCFLLSATLAGAEIIEEETWYNAEGQVIKTVKRTLTGRDAQKEPDWEPAWVIRERNRDQRSGRRYYYRPRYSHSRYGYGYGYCGGYYYYPRRIYYGHRSYGRRSYGGVRAYYHHGRVGVSYRAPGISLYYRR